MDVLLVKEVAEELKMGARQSTQALERRYLKVLPLRTCNHCVECCSPEPGNGLASLEYMKYFCHHALPNSPRASPPRKSLLASGLVSERKTPSQRFDYVDPEPSKLRRRRQLPFLPFLDLPQSYTNIPDFYTELLVLQYQINKQEVFRASPAGSSCTGERIDLASTTAGMTCQKAPHKSRFRCEEVIQTACHGSLKRR